MKYLLSIVLVYLLSVTNILLVLSHPLRYDNNTEFMRRRRLSNEEFHLLQSGPDNYYNAEFINSDNSNTRRLAQEHWKSLKHFIDPEKLSHVLTKWKDYNKNTPFPHMYVDDLFPIDVLTEVSNEIPDLPKMEKNKEGCIKGQRCFNTEVEKFKNQYDNDIYHGPATASLFAYLKSSMFIKFLEKLTGIEDIIPDPHYRGSGIHQTLPGGFLNIHADFNRYERYDLHRRVNVLLYLNPDWNETWGGHLELWSRDLQNCEVKLAPTLGRMVVFSSTDFSYHGHQEPLKAPLGRSRKSLAMYYYTRTRPKHECIGGNCFSRHTTLFQTTKCPTCTSQCDVSDQPKKSKSWSWFQWW
jgi:hypothetical protein